MRYGRFTLAELFFKCWACISIIVFTHEQLMRIKFINDWEIEIIRKLEFTNYGEWFWWSVGGIVAIVWHLTTWYKRAKRQHDTQQINRVKGE